MRGIQEAFIGELAFIKSKYLGKWMFGESRKNIPGRINCRNKAWVHKSMGTQKHGGTMYVYVYIYVYVYVYVCIE